MTEQIVGEVIDCPRCGIGFTVEGGEAHAMRHRREDVVNAGARDMNVRGVDFQPGQRWAFKHGPRGVG